MHREASKLGQKSQPNWKQHIVFSPAARRKRMLEEAIYCFSAAV
jgi:hypothetical protein